MSSRRISQIIFNCELLGTGNRGRTQRRHLGPHGQSSGIFLFDREIENSTGTENPSTQPLSTARKWPWQERAQKSLIFNQPEEKQTMHRKYQWDQRRTTPLFESKSSSEEPKLKVQIIKWPWQLRAKESLIFKEAPAQPYKGIYYPWDQRQSVLSADKDPSARFEAVSRYQQDFHQTKVDIHSIPPAGKTCYGTMLDVNRPGKAQFNHQAKKGWDADGVGSFVDDGENLSPSSNTSTILQPQPRGTYTVLKDRTNTNEGGQQELSRQFAQMGVNQKNQQGSGHSKQFASIFVKQNRDQKQHENDTVTNIYPVPVVINLEPPK